MEEQQIDLVPYTADWVGKFEAEKAQIEQVLAPYPHAIEHIGSTAVPGIEAKPIIDIAVKIESLGIVPLLIIPLAGIGYQYDGEFGLPGRHFFTRGTPREYHLHIVDDTTDHWKRWIAFRTTLRADETARQAYMDLKRDLAAEFRTERQKYTAGKSDHIEAVLQKALKDNG